MNNIFIKCTLVFLILMFSSKSFAKSIEEQFKDAESLIEIDQTKEALQILKGIEPENNVQIAEQSYLLGRLYFSLGKFSKADEFYMDANLQNPMESKYQVALSQTSYALGKMKLAERHAHAALREDPDLIEAELMIALILSRYGEVTLAEKRFLALMDLQPTSEPLFVAYAKFLEKSDLRKKAIDTLEEFILKHPNNPDALDYVGRLYWFSGRAELAFDRRSRAADLYENYGKLIIAKAIRDWIASTQKTTTVEKNKEETEKKKALPPKKERRYIPSNGNQIEPFPINANDYVYTGSGFIINDGRQVVTNKHVIEGGSKIFVRNGLGELRHATISKVSLYDDLALLDLDNPYDPDYAMDIPDNYQLRVGQAAMIMGFPMASVIGESAPSITQGIVSKNTGLGDNVGTFLLTSKLNKGNSGGPIFSDSGEIIGVAVAKLDKTLMLEETGFIPEDVNIGIQIDRVQRFIQSSSSVNQVLPKLDLADLYELKLPSVAMILVVMPPEAVVQEASLEDQLEGAIKECQASYETENVKEITKEQYDRFCECYIHGISEEYDEKEARYQSEHDNEPSEGFLKKIESIADQCIQKVQ